MPVLVRHHRRSGSGRSGQASGQSCRSTRAGHHHIPRHLHAGAGQEAPEQSWPTALLAKLCLVVAAPRPSLPLRLAPPVVAGQRSALRNIRIILITVPAVKPAQVISQRATCLGRRFGGGRIADVRRSVLRRTAGSRAEAIARKGKHLLLLTGPSGPLLSRQRGVSLTSSFIPFLELWLGKGAERTVAIASFDNQLFALLSTSAPSPAPHTICRWPARFAILRWRGWRRCSARPAFQC